MGNFHVRIVHWVRIRNLKPVKQNADHVQAERMDLRWKMVLTAVTAAKRKRWRKQTVLFHSPLRSATLKEPQVRQRRIVKVQIQCGQAAKLSLQKDASMVNSLLTVVSTVRAHVKTVLQRPRRWDVSA